MDDGNDGGDGVHTASLSAVRWPERGGRIAASGGGQELKQCDCNSPGICYLKTEEHIEEAQRDVKLLEERIAIKSVAAAAADLKSACGIDGRRSANSGPAGIGLAAPLGLAAPPASLGQCGGPCCVLWAVANVDGLLSMVTKIESK